MLSSFVPSYVAAKFQLSRPEYTPLHQFKHIFGVHNLVVKDEGSNLTGSITDRFVFEMLSPVVSQIQAGNFNKPITFAVSNLPGIQKSIDFYCRQLDAQLNRDLVGAIIFVSGMNRPIQANPFTVLKNDGLSFCTVVQLRNLLNEYTPKDLEEIAQSLDICRGTFVDATRGIERASYSPLMREIIEQNNGMEPNYVVAPFEDPILCNEIEDYISDHQLDTKLIPVSLAPEYSENIQKYSTFHFSGLKIKRRKWYQSIQEPFDKKNRYRRRCEVFHAKPEATDLALTELRQRHLSASAQSAASFSILRELPQIDPSFDSTKHSVAVINIARMED